MIFNVQTALSKNLLYFFYSLERLNIKAHEEILICINLFFPCDIIRIVLLLLIFFAKIFM